MHRHTELERVDPHYLSWLDLVQDTRLLGPEDGFAVRLQDRAAAVVFSNGVGLIAKGLSIDDTAVRLVFGAARRAGFPAQLVEYIDPSILANIDAYLADFASMDEPARSRRELVSLRHRHAILAEELADAKEQIELLSESVQAGESQVSDMAARIESLNVEIESLNAALASALAEKNAIMARLGEKC
jgi:hypothetical protein